MTIDDSASGPPPLLEPQRAGQSRRGWIIHIVILAAYPLVIGGLSFLSAGEASGPVLPADPAQLFTVMAVELGIFALVFFSALLASRPRLDQLYLKWRGGILPVLRGAGYSVVLRIGTAVIMLILFAIGFAMGRLESEDVEQLRPKVEVLVDPVSLAEDPVYFWISVTIVSFILAGLREELWRAGLLAGLRALFPRQFERLPFRVACVCAIAVLFGLGHIPQGGSAVVLTMALGIGLGAIMIYHDSIWDAVLAHGFFNATSFALLAWVAEKYPGALG